MKLSIVIPVFNKWPFTKTCLAGLMHLPNDHEIIVIDNASSDETKSNASAFIEELHTKHKNGPRITYVRNEENVFHSKACNQGFRLSTGDNVLFLNNDIVIRYNHITWTQKLIDAEGIVSPTMGQLDDKLQFVKEGYEQLSGNSYLGGWCIAAKRETWKLLDKDGTGQVWNEDFPFYFNDTDLSFRARQKNIPLTVVGLTGVTHFGKVSAAQINIQKLYTEGRTVFLKNWSKR